MQFVNWFDRYEKRINHLTFRCAFINEHETILDDFTLKDNAFPQGFIRIGEL